VGIAQFLPGVIGASVGCLGWLFVGLYINRTQQLRVARSAARAVYFEITVNRLAMDLASRYGTFAPLARTGFDRLLPDLSTRLGAADLQQVVRAYLGHAGYEQAASDGALPLDQRARILAALVAAQDVALGVLSSRAFSPDDLRALAATPAGPREPSS
jgi:hypothetical protein